MSKRFIVAYLGLLLACASLPTSAHAWRLKVYALPQAAAPGQLARIVFENPNQDQPFNRTQCTAPKLIAWVKSDIPILRIEQRGKQIWTSLGSYESIGDSVVASFMVPLALDTGRATLYLVNGRDASIPYHFDVTNQPSTALIGTTEPSITPGQHFHLIGEGFVPSSLLSTDDAKQALETNIGLSKLSASQQWNALNHRMEKEWDKLPEGDFLCITQGSTTWRAYVQSCGIVASGLTLEFIAPPDLKPGNADLVLKIRMDSKEVAKSKPLSVTIN